MTNDSVIVRLKTFLGYYYYGVFKPSQEFLFQGERYRYLRRKYNATWRNERAVEIPIFWRIVQSHWSKKILEVGNVLSHYYLIQHEVVDKYEQGPGVINQDIVDFRPDHYYDLIVSISTLEHIGWDETPRDATKIFRVLEHLKSLLVPGGKIVMSMPLGYNPILDALLRENKLVFTQQLFMQKIAKPSTWLQVEWELLKEAWPNYTNSTATVLMVGILEDAHRD